MIPRDEIVSIAREAGFAQSWSEAAGEALERFAALVAAKVIARTPPPPLVVSMSDVDQAKLAAMLEKAPAMPLVVAPDDSKLAACFDQIKSDLIADGAVEHDLRLEFFPEAVLDAFRRQRAARIEAQQRLADAQELAAPLLISGGVVALLVLDAALLGLRWLWRNRGAYRSWRSTR